MTHPVNIRPSMPTPASLPLQDGRITCVTCHDASPEHGSTRQSVGLRGGGTNLCMQCHQRAIPGTKSIHTVTTGRAHLVAEMPFGSRRAVTGLDPESRACLGCHDGAMGADIGGHQVRVGDSDAQSEHPVGVPMRSTDRTKRGDFKLAAVVDKRVRLFGGVIGCGSCHSMYSREASQLVTSNQNSKLCLTCHTQ